MIDPQSESEHIEDFYSLCSILNDDTRLIAEIVQQHQPQRESLKIIYKNISQLRLNPYNQIIIRLLDKPIAYLRAFETIKKYRDRQC